MGAIAFVVGVEIDRLQASACRSSARFALGEASRNDGNARLQRLLQEFSSLIHGFQVFPVPPRNG